MGMLVAKRVPIPKSESKVQRRAKDVDLQGFFTDVEILVFEDN